jgi:two-component system chemotaxis response regulator CheB/chemosensory pili system protein ChpB (putative protein-glutamate methylesterase)
MSEPTAAPGVAVVSADAELGTHLREALQALGARIVHEGGVDTTDPQTLAQSGADVVVVNLAPGGDEHLDALCAALEEGPQRVVFNDADVSRQLSGWDKARWARHLAVKLLGTGDVDPPRPATHGAETAPIELAAGADSESVIAAAESIDAPPAETTASSKDAATDMLDEMPAPPAVDVEKRQTESLPGPAVDWELVDFEAAPPAPVEREDPTRFGVEKIDPAASLCPDDGDGGSFSTTDFEMELVSLEETATPSRVDVTVSEMMLDAGIGDIRRVVLVAAGAEATAELGEFLAALPKAFSGLVLVLQPGQDRDADALAAAFDVTVSVPLKLAHDGERARPGEAWLVPGARAFSVGRNGHITLADADAGTAHARAIDRCLEALVHVFGSDTTAIVLAGDGEDALAGAHAVVEHDGRVWTVDPAACDGATGTAAAIGAQGLASFRGAPGELAARLTGEGT